MTRYNEGSVQTCCFSRTSNKEKYLKVVVCIFLSYSDMGHVMQNGPGRHDTWFRVICRQNKSKMAEALRYIHSRSDFYGFNCYFQTFITSIMLFGEWSGPKSLKLKMDKICCPGPFRMTQPICNWNFVRFCVLSAQKLFKIRSRGHCLCYTLHEHSVIFFGNRHFFFQVYFKGDTT